jgi:hypothetical protein
MTLNKLASMIAKREGKKSQARIGDIREILGILADLNHEDTSPECDILNCLNGAGSKRAKRKAKK